VQDPFIWMTCPYTLLMPLVLSNNELIGPLPSWMNTLHCMFYMDMVSNNSQTEDVEIPIALTEMPKKATSGQGCTLFGCRVLLATICLPLSVLNLSSN
jgi:hypothetical protein